MWAEAEEQFGKYLDTFIEKELMRTDSNATTDLSDLTMIVDNNNKVNIKNIRFISQIANIQK